MRSRVRGRWLALLLPLLGGAAALIASWQRWINPFVDSGREMDVPWRLLQGERLYHDVTYYYGPLGPWLNALALWLFGHHWIVLQALCLAISVAIFALLYRLTREAGSRLAAIAATTLAAAVCMGAPHGGAFIFPYSSSCLLGLAGGLLALWLVCLPPRALYLAAAAAGLTVALASRLEVGAAAAAALVLAAVRARPRRETLGTSTRRWRLPATPRHETGATSPSLKHLSDHPPLTPRSPSRSYQRPPGPCPAVPGGQGTPPPTPSGRELGLSLGVVAAATLAAGAIYALALRGITWSEMRHDGPFTHLFGMPPEWHKLYLEVAGLDRPLRNGMQVALGATIDAGLLALLGWFALPAARGRRLLFPVTMLALLAAYLASPFADPLKNLPPMTLALPLLTAAAAAAVLLRRPLAGQDRARFLLFGFSAALALRVLFDLPLGPRMGPYTALPMPGVLATAAVLAFDGLAPRLPDPAAFRRRLAVLLLVIGALFLYRLGRLDRGPDNLVVETSAGALRLPARQARPIGDTLRYLERRARPGDRLTAFPESGFFNFVTQLRSPLRQDQIFPGVLRGERETETARQIERAGPRFILLCNRPTPEYGPAAFGIDYDVWLWQDIERRYALTAAYGWVPPATEPPTPGHFFIRVYERAPQPGEPPLQVAERRAAPAPAGALTTGREASRRVGN